MNDSLEETAVRRQADRDRAAERRLNESLEETAAREIERLRAANCRAVAQQQRSASARHHVCDQRRLGHLVPNCNKFR